MTETLPASVLKNTFSLNDIYQRANILTEFFEKYFFDANGPRSGRIELLQAQYQNADEETRSHVRAIAAWGSEILDAFTAEKIHERTKQLKEGGEALPRLSLDVPVHFSSEHVERIGTWCRANVLPSIMLEFRVRPESLGGCVYVYNNTLHDFSLSYFAAQRRAELLKVVRAYD